METETTMEELFDSIRNTEDQEERLHILEDIRLLIEEDVNNYYLIHTA